MAKPRMTPEQAYATHPSLTAWVGASAGTGKTHVLTARVLRLMLTGTSPENIVCLTFTKAAAAEMTNRIFEELGRWALMPDQTLAAEINRRTEEVPDADMLTRARQLFAEVLDLSPGLQIMTFHSFCQSLLGRFPLEAGMAPGFEGLDEAEARDLLATAKDDMLEATRIPKNTDLRQALSDVAALVTENTFDEVIDRLAYEAPTLLRAEAAYGGLNGVEAALYRALELTPGDTLQRLIMTAVSNANLDVTGIPALGAALLAGSAKEVEKGQALNAFLTAREVDRVDLFDDYRLVFLTAQHTARKTVANKPTLARDPSLHDIIAKEQSRLAWVTEQLLKLKVAAATASLLKLGIAQLSTYRHLKSERGLVDFDDMIQRTVGLFQQASVAPWILFKLDAAIEHLLVDEAQDTNRDQWQVVEALTSEFFAGEGASDTARTIFAVGDTKQSIFSFQRADPREFIAARERVFQRAAEADLPASNIPMNLSFRSGKAVLALVDAVFDEEAKASLGLALDGGAVEHAFQRKGHGGLVEMWPLEAPRDKAKEDTPEWALPLVQESVDDAEQRTAWRIAARIKKMISGGEMLEAQGRPISAGDILVLVRRRTAFVDHLVRALKTMAVPVAGRDRMVLTDELPVMDLTVLARFALQPMDDLSLATVLKGPFVGMDEEALFELAYGRKGTLWQALLRRKSEGKFAGIAAMLKRLLDGVDVKTPFEFFSHLLTDLGGRTKLVARLGDEIHDPIDELLEEALRFELTGAASMQAFLDSVDKGGLQIKRDLEAAGDNVRIMTAHSAKGLQAPIVFLSDLVGLPDTSRETRLMTMPGPVDGAPPLPVWTSPGIGLALVDTLKADVKAKQIAEYRRLLYVALTRAEDRLYIAGWQAKGEPAEECWASAIKEGFERLGAEDVALEGGDIGLRWSVAQTAEVATAEAAETVRPIMKTPNWLFEAMPEEPAPAKPLAPSRPEEEPAVTGPLTRTSSHRFKRGRHIHAMLQWLPDTAHDVRETAALTFLAKSAPELADVERENLWREVEAVLIAPSFAAVFGPDSLAEVPIAGIVSGRAIAGQVDRLIVTENDVLVVDYKTNRPPPKDVSGVAAVYLRQMGLYRRALEGIYVGKNVRAALLWTDSCELMELPKSLMDEALTASGL
jgi:ATP-dependent helicase/nuclease subunit A